jgi:hypothetical protein
MRAEAVETLFDEWVSRYRRGDRPDPREYLARSGALRDELASLIDGYLALAPRPELNLETVDVVNAWIGGESPLVLLRARRGLTREKLLDTLSTRFGLSRAQQPALAERYHELEAGLLDPARLSRRLAAFLAERLQTTEDVIRVWTPRTLHAAPAFRSSAAPSSAVRRIPQYDEEVDRLFLSDEGRR